jgi:hypothetical protein
MPYLFHVTTADRLDGIAEEGLCPGRGSAIGGVPDSHKQGRVFLSEFEGTSYWASRAEDWVTSEHDEYAELGMALVVTRVPRASLDPALLKDDELGTTDSRKPAYAYEGDIAPEDVEVWDGASWMPAADARIDASLGFTEDGYFHDASPLLNPPLPIPPVEALPQASGFAAPHYPNSAAVGWDGR